MNAFRSRSVASRLCSGTGGGSGAGASGRSGRFRRLQQDSEAGFTLAEVIVAMVIFVVAALAATSAIIAAGNTQNSTEARVVAANLARDEIERVRTEARGTAVANLAPVAYPPITRNGREFTVTRTLGSASCTDGVRSVTVQVTWPRAGAPVRSDTVLAC